jgi:hypothetical protein
MTAALLACGCSNPSTPPAPQAGSSAGADLEYAAPPAPRSVAPAAEGAIALSGVARPDALVRLASPDGAAIGATASNSGAWTLMIPGASELRLYSLSEDAAGNPLRARGYVAAWPAPELGAATLRPGAGAERLDRASGLAISALDYDASGAAVASGFTRPDQTVRLSLDGADAGEDHADAAGRFSVSLTRALTPGRHVLAAVGGDVRVRTAFEASPPGPLPHPPYAAARQGQAWRIDWMTPGGGLQTTLLFDLTGADR